MVAVPVRIVAVADASLPVCSKHFCPGAIVASSDPQKCPNGSCKTPELTSQAESAVSRRNWGAAVGVTGLVLTAGGIGWYFFNENQKPPANTAPKAAAFQPWIGPQVAGLSVQMSLPFELSTRTMSSFLSSGLFTVTRAFGSRSSRSGSPLSLYVETSSPR